MEKQFGKPLTIDLNYSLQQAANSENAKMVINKKAGGIATGKKAKELQQKSGQFAAIKTKEHQSKAGQKGGQKHIESGHWSNIQKLAALNANEKIECHYCKKMIDRKNYGRWHGDNCKMKQS